MTQAPSRRILILDGSGIDYDGARLDRPGIGGIQTTAADLAMAFARAGHKVSVATGCTTRVDIAGVTWLPLGEARSADPEIAIAINNPSLFDLAGTGRPFLWLHNEVRVEKLFRRRQIGPLLRWRPTAVFIGTYQAGNCSRLLPFRGRHIIHHGISAPFLGATPSETIPAPVAIYTSQAYRGFADMARLWAERVHPVLPDALFNGFVGADFPVAPEWAAAGVRVHARLPRSALIAELRRARLMLLPGHRDETFCLAAAEAICVGTPVATKGIGALAERVRDGIDGFVTRDEAGLAAHVVDILKDDALWRRLHEAAATGHGYGDWDAAARAWQVLFDTTR